MNYPCYTTRTGIKIGSRYTPPHKAPEMSRDELDLQAALLGKNERNILEELLVVFGAAVFALIFVGVLIKMWRF